MIHNTSAIERGQAVAFVNGSRRAMVTIYDGYMQVTALTQGAAIMLGHWYQIYRQGNRYYVGPEIAMKA